MRIDEGYDELLASIKNVLVSDTVTDCDEHIAVHVNVTDMGNRPFYIELADRRIKVEPYGYYDSDVVLNADSQIIMAMVNKEIDIKHEYVTGRVGAYGNLYKLATLRNIIVRYF